MQASNAMNFAAAVRTIRRAFGLTARDAADILGVSPATVHQATSSTEFDDSALDFNRQRVAHLYRIAQLWIERGPLIGKWETHRLPSGQTVMEMLKAPVPSEPAFMEAHETLHRMRDYLRAQESAGAIAGLRAMARAFRKRKTGVPKDS